MKDNFKKKRESYVIKGWRRDKIQTIYIRVKNVNTIKLAYREHKGTVIFAHQKGVRKKLQKIMHAHCFTHTLFIYYFYTVRKQFVNLL